MIAVDFVVLDRRDAVIAADQAGELMSSLDQLEAALHNATDESGRYLYGRVREAIRSGRWVHGALSEAIA